MFLSLKVEEWNNSKVKFPCLRCVHLCGICSLCFSDPKPGPKWCAGEESWKELVENPDKWWDNRIDKVVHIVFAQFCLINLLNIDYLSQYRCCLCVEKRKSSWFQAQGDRWSTLAKWVSYLGVIKTATSQEETRNHRLVALLETLSPCKELQVFTELIIFSISSYASELLWIFRHYTWYKIA